MQAQLSWVESVCLYTYFLKNISELFKCWEKTRKFGWKHIELQAKAVVSELFLLIPSFFEVLLVVMSLGKHPEKNSESVQNNVLSFPHS